MPRKISERTLSAISGEHIVSGTQSLLDSTLNVLANKRKQQEHQQIIEQRGQQIEMQRNELIEHEKTAYIRDLTRQKATKQLEHDASRQDITMRYQDYAQDVSNDVNKVKAHDAASEILLQALDTPESFHRELKNSVNISPDVKKMLSELDVSTVEGKKNAIEILIGDKKHKQALSLQQSKANSKASATGGLKKDTQAGKNVAGFFVEMTEDEGEQSKLYSVAQDVTERLRTSVGADIKVSEVAELMAIEGDKGEGMFNDSPFRTGNDRFIAGKDSWDAVALGQHVESILANDPNRAKKASTNDAEWPQGLTAARANKIMREQGYSKEELIEAWVNDHSQ